VPVADGLTPPPTGQTYQIWCFESPAPAISASCVPAGEHSAVLLRGSWWTPRRSA